MGGIVIELQREALDEKISIESLIRKAYLVAKKLKLKEFEEWLNQEQNGYKKEIPEYRNITGEIKAWKDSNDITCKSGRYSFKNAHSKLNIFSFRCIQF